MRKKYELDAIDNTCMITIGETVSGDRIAFSINHSIQDPIDFELSATDFQNLCDLRYRLCLNPPSVSDKPKLAQVA
jgi:hypothetical protein